MNISTENNKGWLLHRVSALFTLVIKDNGGVDVRAANGEYNTLVTLMRS